ncbi:hypothetical protein NHQ30_001788 [Ciborinia camelliae]|nr:hypothetical protein NHQ30_001788 [Ciborinia camelliae]
MPAPEISSSASDQLGSLPLIQPPPVSVSLRSVSSPTQSLVLAAGTGLLIWLIKLSLFSLIYNAFRPLAYVRILVVTGLILSAAWYIAAAAIIVTRCGPKGGTDRISYLAGLASPTCGHILTCTIVTGVVNIVIDVYLLVIPLAAISHLHLPRKRKIGVFFIFLTGGGTIEYTVGVIIPCMAPSAKVWSQTSARLTSYVRTRFKGFSSIDDSMSHEMEMKPMPRGRAQPFSEMDTIDEMLLRIPPSALKSQSQVERGQSP